MRSVRFLDYRSGEKGGNRDTFVNIADEHHLTKISYVMATINNLLQRPKVSFLIFIKIIKNNTLNYAECTVLF